MIFSEFNSLRNQLQKDIPSFEPEYVFLNNYRNVINMTPEEFAEAIDNCKDHIRKRRAMKPAMVFKLTQIANQASLPQHIKSDIIDQLHKYEDCKLSEIPDIEISLKPYPTMTFMCKKTYSDAHNEFAIQVQEIQEQNIKILKKYIKNAQEDQTNITIIKTICEEINKKFPELGNELYEMSITFIGALVFKDTQEAKLIIKKISTLLSKIKFSSQKEKTEFIQEIIQMLKNHCNKPKRSELANTINILIKRSQIQQQNTKQTVYTAKTSAEKLLLSIIPNGTKNKYHIRKRNAIIEYLRKNPNTPISKVRKWANGIRTGAFTLRELNN